MAEQIRKNDYNLTDIYVIEAGSDKDNYQNIPRGMQPGIQPNLGFEI